MQMTTPFSFKVGGQAGQGVKSAGQTFSKVAVRSGYHIYNYTEYPSLIRGGHNVIQTVVSAEEAYSPVNYTNFLVALNPETINLHKDELAKGAGVLFDAEEKANIATIEKTYRLFPIPLAKLAREVNGEPILKNTVALGAVLALLGGKLDHLKDLISEEFSRKDPEIVRQNLAAAQGGYDFAKKNFPAGFAEVLKPREKQNPKMVICGNEAVALGAIAAGLQFAAIYPMTPVSGILHFLAANQEKFGYVYKLPEDEIAGINMAIGASFAGARSMVATSGGGFCLMTEGYGLAGMTENPLVIVEGMRTGPATGMPTWSEQGDLQFVLHAHQSEFPRVVLAAGDAKEAFFLTLKAFNLADKYQTPVVLLVDKNICENDQSFSSFDYAGYRIDRGRLLLQKSENFQRYELAKDGISPRTIPGLGTYFKANSDEHDSLGFSTDKSIDRNQQMAKRMQKLATCAAEDMAEPLLFGPKEADITIVSWGSNKGSIREAMKNFPNVNYLHLSWINPFPAEAVQKILGRARHIIDIEANFSGQMASLIREKTGIEIKDRLLKYDGRPFFPEEISKAINDYLMTT